MSSLGGDEERAADERFWALFDTMVDGLIVVDKGGVVRAVNRAAERMFGYRLEDVAGRSASLFVPEAARSAAGLCITDILPRRGLAADGADRYEITGLRRDGSEFPLELWIQPLPHGEHRHFICTVRENVARRQRDAALCASESRFRRVADALPSLVAYIGPDGHYRVCNRAHENWFGVPCDLIVGEHVRDVLGEAGDTILRAVPVGEPAAFDAELPFRDGGPRSVHAACVPEIDRDGTVLGCHVLVTDLTERRRAEKELDHGHRMKAVGQLTSGLAHDFNNLLGVLMLDLEALGETVDGDERDGILADAVAAVHSGRNLTRYLLGFSRRQPLEASAVDLAPLVDRVASVMRRAVGEDVEIDVVADQSLWAVRCDPGMLENALLDLVLNARDAMPSGGRVTIAMANAPGQDFGAESGSGRGDYVRLSVSDTGGGMPQDVIDSVFDPFSIPEDAEGRIGRGLSIVHDFVSRSAGRILFDSDVGRGTTVHLYLPHWPAEAAPSDEATILLVEDFTRLRQRTAKLVESLGYRVISVANGREALTALDENPEIDLLFTDIVMPGGIGGAELARRARKRRPYLRTLFLTGYSERDRSASRELQSLPAEAILLTKPFSKDTLLAAIDAALGPAAAVREESRKI